MVSLDTGSDKLTSKQPASLSEDKTWWVYLLRCADQSLYCGITNNLQKRLRQHNGELKGGAKYTRAKGPCSLVYQELMKDQSIALKREREIKKLSKLQKEQLITQNII